MKNKTKIRPFIVAIVGVVALSAGTARAATINVEGGAVNIGVRLQANVNYVDEDVGGNESAADTSFRRAYIYASGKIHPTISYFAHFGGDRLGQSVDLGTGGPFTSVTGNGLGDGAAVRDAWVNWAPMPEFQIQVGRMLVPFLRNFGTHSGFTNMAYDYASFQQANLIPGRRVGRDDGVMLLGELQGGKISYRLAMMDGSANSTNTTRGNNRLAGHLWYSAWEPETGFWWQGTYLDKKKVLTFGVGFDRLDGASVGPDLVDHSGVSADAYMNLPVTGGAITAELNYAQVEQQIAVPGVDRPAAGTKSQFTGDYILINLGYLFAAKTKAGQVQPYVRYENFSADGDNIDKNNSGLPDSEFAVGLNQYLEGHGTKLTWEYTQVSRRGDSAAAPDFNRAGLQLQVSF
jgi:hypothetical protein